MASTSNTVRDLIIGILVTVVGGLMLFIIQNKLDDKEGKELQKIESDRRKEAKDEYIFWIDKAEYELSLNNPQIEIAETYYERALANAKLFGFREDIIENGLEKCQNIRSNKLLEQKQRELDKERELERISQTKQKRQDSIINARIQSAREVNVSRSGNYFIDSRDKKRYKYVELLDGKKWMAQNLTYTSQNISYKYKNRFDNSYGIGYDWYNAKKVCPEGWRLPSDKEWRTMISKYGDYCGMQDNEQGKELYKALGVGGATGLNLKKDQYWSASKWSEHMYGRYFRVEEDCIWIRRIE